MQKKTTIKETLCACSGGEIRSALAKADENALEGATEARFRTERPVVIKKLSGEFFLAADGELLATPDGVLLPSSRDIAACVEVISGYSLYAFEDELKSAFLSIRGGSRAGICGRAVIENGEIKTVKNISSLNIRLSREITGCANEMLRYSAKGGLKHTLVISPPGRGKTTLLRDAARQISDIYEKTVAIADERGEIAACWMGIPQNNVGCRTDILDACPKTKAIPLLIRSMAPDVVIADEIGTNDAEVIEDAHAAGVKVFSSAHGANLTDIMKRPSVSALFAKRIFERYIVLTSYGKMGIDAVYDENFKSLSIKDYVN